MSGDIPVFQLLRAMSAAEIARLFTGGQPAAQTGAAAQNGGGGQAAHLTPNGQSSQWAQTQTVGGATTAQATSPAPTATQMTQAADTARPAQPAFINAIDGARPADISQPGTIAGNPILSGAETARAGTLALGLSLLMTPRVSVAQSIAQPVWGGGTAPLGAGGVVPSGYAQTPTVSGSPVATPQMTGQPIAIPTGGAPPPPGTGQNAMFGGINSVGAQTPVATNQPNIAAQNPTAPAAVSPAQTTAPTSTGTPQIAAPVDAKPAIAQSTTLPQNSGLAVGLLPTTETSPILRTGTGTGLGAEEMLARLLPTAITQSPAGQAGAIGNLVIYNAAMIPGWPYASAFAKDGVQAAAVDTALRDFAKQLKGLSPAEQAEYLAKLGAPFAVLGRLRKILKELEGVDKETVEGLLAAFLRALNVVAQGIKASLSLTEDYSALQARIDIRDEISPKADRSRLRL